MICNRVECRLVVAILFITTLSACGPQNYNDCILENMRGLTSDDAAREVRRACLRKFDGRTFASAPSECRTRPMTATELANLQISGRTSYEGLKFSVYNGNNTSVEKMSVRITDISFSAPQDYTVLNGRPLVLPNAAAQDLLVKVATLPSNEWRFELLSAETCSE